MDRFAPPGWAGDVLQAIHGRLRKGNFPADETEALRQTLVTFCGDAASSRPCQNCSPTRSCSTSSTVPRERITRRLVGSTATPAGRQGHSRPRARVLALVHSRQIAALDSEVDRIAADGNEPREIRLGGLERPGGEAAASRIRVRVPASLLQPESMPTPPNRRGGVGPREAEDNQLRDSRARNSRGLIL